MIKKSFVLYTDSREIIEKLTNEQAGILIKAIMRYSAGEEPPEMDALTDIVFSTIRIYLDKDFEKYKEICIKRKEAGKKGGAPKGNKNAEKQSKQANALKNNQNKQKQAKQPDNDNDNDNDNEIIKENNKRKKSNAFIPPTLEEVANYCNERNNKVDPQRFIDFYSASGWMRGKNKIKDWKACIRTWERSSGIAVTPASTKNNAFMNFDQRNYDELTMQEIERKMQGL